MSGYEYCCWVNGGDRQFNLPSSAWTEMLRAWGAASPKDRLTLHLLLLMAFSLLLSSSPHTHSLSSSSSSFPKVIHCWIWQRNFSWFMVISPILAGRGEYRWNNGAARTVGSSEGGHWLGNPEGFAQEISLKTLFVGLTTTIAQIYLRAICLTQLCSLFCLL